MPTRPSVAARPTLVEAQVALARREVFGIVGIPAGTEREVMKGSGARLPAFVDSAYFLLYNRTLQGIQEATGAVTADLIARSARPDGSLYWAALAKSSPVEILNQPLFNPTGGYGSYIVPAAFVLILQQTLLIGSATLGGVAFEQGGSGAAAAGRRGFCHRPGPRPSPAGASGVRPLSGRPAAALRVLRE
jgi:ABC-2 type transport system permease protein